jgi:hypothetical protein
MVNLVHRRDVRSAPLSLVEAVRIVLNCGRVNRCITIKLLPTVVRMYERPRLVDTRRTSEVSRRAHETIAQRAVSVFGDNRGAL